MKRFTILLITAFTVVLSACYKDTGNYNYNDINEIAISGIAGSYSVVFSLDVLHIEPDVTMTEEDTDPGRFSYYWVLCKGYTPIDTVGRERVLDYRVNAAPDVYNLYLRIKDNQTKMTWQKGAVVTIGTRFSNGIMLMGTNEAGHAEMDMITMVNDTLVTRGLLSESGLPVLNGPITVVHNGSKDTNFYQGRVWVMTQSGSYFLDRKTLRGNPENTFGRIVNINDPLDKETLNPILYAPQFRDRNGNTGNAYARAMMTNDGNIFAVHTYLTGGDFYLNPVNREEANFEKLLKTAPYFFYGIGNMNAIIWYDKDNDRFMNYSTFGTGAHSLKLNDNPADLFPWNQAGRTLVYGENTRNTDGGSTNGNSFAIMKDKGNNNMFIYKFYANAATPAKRDMYEVKAIARDFDKATAYAFSSRRSVIFYVVDNKLYGYDYNPGYEKFYEFPQFTGDEITMLKFDTQIDFATNSLYIATYNGTAKGRLRRFMVGTDPNTVTISAVNRADWDNLVKIKDMNWRAFN